MTDFTTKVDKRSRKAMTDYLEDHFTYCDRYRTGYAHKVKVRYLDNIDYDKAMELLYDEDDGFFVYQKLDRIIDEYNESWLGRHANIKWAGGSGGYLVLHFKGEWGLYDSRYDENIDFEDLKFMVELVQEFDRCVQEVYAQFKHMCEEGL